MEEKEGDALQAIMQEPQVMYAYEGPLTDEEVRTWLNRQLERCARFGFGLWAVILKETGRVVGQCGLTMQLWKKESVLKISYLFRWDAWHRGYAPKPPRHAGSTPFPFRGYGRSAPSFGIPTWPPRTCPDETACPPRIPGSSAFGAMTCPTSACDNPPVNDVKFPAKNLRRC